MKKTILISLLAVIAVLTISPLPALAECTAAIGADCGGTECSDGASCAGGEGTCRIQPPLENPSCIRNEAGDEEETPTTATTLPARQLTNPLGDVTSIPQVIGKVAQMFTGIAGSLALLMFVYGGVLWLTSGGSEERIASGKKAIVWATIGLFVIFSAYAVLALIFQTLGATL